MKVRSKVWFEVGGKLVFGVGRARILRAVEKTGSLNKAARELGMSYRHTWSSIRAAEERLGKSLLISRRGGRERGGTTLTPYARKLLKKFDSLDAAVSSCADRKFKTFLLSCLLVAAAFHVDAKAGEIMKLATTTSTYETGLLDHIVPPFEAKHDVKVHIISVGTGKAIKIAENGDVDIIMVHARQAEDKFVADGYGVNRRDVMYNDFLIMGPEKDLAGIAGMKDAARALRRILETGQTFVSRGDDSGTHKKEQLLWKKAGLTPSGKRYLEAGQGMSATLRMADEKNAYVMLDRATYLANRDKVRLRKMVEGDPDLFNPYGVIAVSPYKYPHVKYEPAMALIGWLTSPECQAMIGAYKRHGEQLYHPNASDLK